MNQLVRINNNDIRPSIAILASSSAALPSKQRRQRGGRFSAQRARQLTARAHTHTSSLRWNVNDDDIRRGARNSPTVKLKQSSNQHRADLMSRSLSATSGPALITHRQSSALKANQPTAQEDNSFNVCSLPLMALVEFTVFQLARSAMLSAN